jgi:hypothetical protein
MYAPTFLTITIILEFLDGFVGATLRGRPIILAKIRIAEIRIPWLTKASEDYTIIIMSKLFCFQEPGHDNTIKRSF